MQADRLVVASPQPGQRGLWLVVGLLAACAAYIGLLAAGGEARDLAVAGVGVLPFLVLALLAYAGVRRTWARVLTSIWLAIVTASAVVVAVAFSRDALQPTGVPLTAAQHRQVVVAAAGAVLGLALGWLCFLAPARRALARLLPLDPQSFVHAAALAVVVSSTLIFFVPLIVLGDPPLLLSIQRQGAEQYSSDLLDDLYGLFWLVPAAILAVGYPLVRGWRAALLRLGFVRPTRGEIVLALAAGVALVLIFLVVDHGISALWQALGWPTTDAESFEELLAYAINPLGALVIGVTAGLGEELAIRGVLQPRLGMLVSNLFFTSLHAFQYNFDALLSVFMLGLIFGLIRRRTNTTTSAVVHGFYDFLLIMLTAAGF